MSSNFCNFGVTLNATQVFTDNFSTGTLSGGSGTVLPTALYQVVGTLPKTGPPPTRKAVLDTGLGTQAEQFNPWSGPGQLDYSEAVVQLAAVPEPSSLVLLAACLLVDRKNVLVPLRYLVVQCVGTAGGEIAFGMRCSLPTHR
jgi:hypothetical protein